MRHLPQSTWPRILLVLFTALVIVAAGVGIYFVTRPPLIPATLRAQMNFQIYYPYALPKGMTVEADSFKSPAGNVMVFVINDGKTKINVSEQPVPPATQLDLNQFYSQQLQGTLQYTSPQGPAAIGSLTTGERVGSLVAGSTWVLVSAPKDEQVAQIQSVIAALSPYSP